MTLDDVETKLNATTPISEIRYNLERGRVFKSAKQIDKAHKFFIKAFELSTKQKQDNLSVDAAHMVAIAELNPEKQLEWNLKAIKIAENSKDSKAKDWLGSLYNNLGWTYHDSKNYAQALDFFSKALVFRTSRGDSKSIRIAKWSVARAHRSLNQYGEALKIQKNLENEFEASGEKDGYVFEELAEIYLAEKNRTYLKKYFNLAYTELSKDDWFKKNEASRLQRIFDLSGLSQTK
jgi:tetratricopeptide (TPR) repeat protein